MKPAQAFANLRLEGDHVILRPLVLADVGEAYVDWLNDPRVNRFLESRLTTHTAESVRAYVEKVMADPSHLFLAIVRRTDNQHIGNIKLGPINGFHRTAEIGILIGESGAWGHGFATEAIELLATHALGPLGLAKVTAGCYANNIGSQKAFERARFQVEGIRPNQCVCGDERVDLILMGRLAEDGR